MRFARQSLLRRVATIVMMAATLAFALQGIFVATSEAATGDSSHYYLGFALEHAEGDHPSHLVTHRHADGTVHRHAIDDDDCALDKHIKQPGSNMALVVCVAPFLAAFATFDVVACKLTIVNPRRLWFAEIGGLRRRRDPPA